MTDRYDDSGTTLVLAAAGPLADLVARSVAGREALNELFTFELDCVGADAAMALDDALAKHVSVTLRAGATERALDGLCARISQRPGETGDAHYLLELRPWFWWLTLSSDNRIFQEKSVPDIVEAVFKALGYADYELSLSGSYAARDYCVQYNETDFAFVCRLLEDEGIFYFFRHEAGRHVLVLADANDAFPVCPGAPTIAFMPPGAGVREQQVILSGEMGQQAVTAGYRTSDYAFTTPATSLFAKADVGTDKQTVYDYPGRYISKDAGDAFAKQRVDGLRTGARLLRGTSDSRSLVAGHRLTLAGHERDDANVDWVFCEVRHEASHEHYLNSFVAMPLAQTHRPPRITSKPRIHGTQTAIVVGKSGEEIWTDEYGRIKLQFHWDQLGKSDENSSCWVRVAQMWSGKGWGAQFIPRVGQEVVVSFLDGDPDRPLVTGCVYNGSNALPYALPAEQTKSAIKSQSSKGGGGFNELRFEDKKDAEELYLHAQKDMKTEIINDALRTVGNDDTTQVKQNQTLEVQEGNQSITVTKGNRSAAICQGNDTLTVDKGQREVTVKGDETHRNGANFVHTADGNYTLTIKGNLTIDVTGAVTIKSGKDLSSEAGGALSNKAGSSLSNNAATSLTCEAGTALSNKAGTTLSNKAGTSLTNEATMSLTNKAGASQTVDGGGMLTLKGGLVKIN